jgi:hypothetical protein
MSNRKLQHNHLIDGKYLKEDVIPQLRDNLFSLVEWRVAECSKPDVFKALNAIMEQFEDECVAYDRSKEFAK